MEKITICRFEDAPVAMQHPEGRKMFTSEKLGIVHLTLQPGEKVATHTNPFDVVFFVLSGEGILNADDQLITAGTGTCIEVPPGIERGWENNGTKELKILVIKDFS